MLKFDLILFAKWALPGFLFFYVLTQLVASRIVLSILFGCIIGVVQMTNQENWSSGKR